MATDAETTSDRQINEYIDFKLTANSEQINQPGVLAKIIILFFF